ncbi:MAG: hypothetical protein KGL39_41580 [Patescibacteria group bacterium]|nr:hypothetical protein [Patescibacteria group bacterium]
MAEITNVMAHHRIDGRDDDQRLILAVTFTVDGRAIELDAIAPRTVDGKARRQTEALDDALVILTEKILDAVLNLA